MKQSTSIIDKYRDYQKRLHIGVQNAYRDGHRQIIAMMPTGAGKTLCASGMIERAAPKSGEPVIFVVPRITLCDQAAQSFARAGLRVSIMQSDHPAYDPAAPVQVCSVQTLAQRGLPWPRIRMAIIDEAHIRYKWYWQLRDAHPDMPMIGLTATPTAKGLGKLYATMVVGGSTGELVKAGWLMPSRVYEPCVYDTSGVGTVSGEFNQRELGEAVGDQASITGDVVANWLEKGEARPTLCFPVNKLHSMEIVARFIEAGVEAAHIQDTTPMEERRRIFDAMLAGRVKVISSVGCLTEGLDLTLVSCIIFARPVKSLETHIQMAGRGLRPKMLDQGGQTYDLAKQNCLFFDHGGNTLRLMHWEDYAPDALDDGTKKEKPAYERNAEAKGEQTKCGECAAVKPRGIVRCPYCGHMPKPKDTGVTERSGELALSVGAATAMSWAQRQTFYAELLGYARTEGYKDGWAAYAYKEKTGYWPARAWAELGPTQPGAEVQRWCKHLMVKRIKSYKKQARRAA